MSRVLGALVGLWAAMAVAASEEGGAPAATLRRYALIIGSSEGGAGREKLRHAGSDALAMSRVLEELGGVASADRLLLLEADRAGVLVALSRMRALVEGTPASGGRRELVLYYSGHSRWAPGASSRRWMTSIASTGPWRAPSCGPPSCFSGCRPRWPGRRMAPGLGGHLSEETFHPIGDLLGELSVDGV